MVFTGRGCSGSSCSCHSACGILTAIPAARLDELAKPTLGAGEKLVGLLTDRSAYEDFDVAAAAPRGMGFERLDQLALEHLLGA